MKKMTNKKLTKNQQYWIDDIISMIFENDWNPDGINPLSDYTNAFQDAKKNKLLLQNKGFKDVVINHEKEILEQIEIEYNNRKENK